MSVLRDITAAFGWLSIVPVRAEASARPAQWFPLVGWLFGGVAAGLAYAARLLGPGPLGSALAGGLVVAVWAALSRLLHWDGVADTADGLLGGHSPEQRLEIMHDSRTGAFGVAAIVIGMLLQTLALGALIASGDIWALLAAPVLGRLAATCGLWTIAPARSEGLAALLSASGGPLARLIAVALLAPLLLGATPARAGILCAGLLGALLVPRALARPVEGISGDLLGASVVIVETLVLVAAALMTGV